MNAILKPDQFDLLLRNDFSTFLRRSARYLDPTVTLSWNWHLDVIIDRLMKVQQGEIKRLIINVPPRSLKSMTVSVAWPAWMLGLDPSKRIVCASHAQELADKMARDTLALMGSPWYLRAFLARLATRTATADFETTARGGRLATSVGGRLVGRGGDIIIIDDPLKPDEAVSEAQRQAANDWIDGTVYTRLNDKRTGAIVIIMQRLHLDDVVGHVLEKEDWEVLSLPAIAEEDETWEYSTLRGRVQHRRQAGDLLHPEREPRDVIDRLRRDLGEYVFSAQYQQAPVPLGGGIVKTHWLTYYAPEQRPKTFDTIVQSWDSANKEGELNDYSVCTTWGVLNKKCYLLDVLRERMTYPDLKRAVVAQAEKWKANIVLIEDKASGTQLVQELRESLPRVKAIKSEGDKIMRMLAQTPQIENGAVLLPEQAPWLPTYVQELTTFPKGKYDDQVDSTAQALKWIATENLVPNAILFMRQEADRLGIKVRKYGGEGDAPGCTP